MVSCFRVTATCDFGFIDGDSIQHSSLRPTQETPSFFLLDLGSNYPSECFGNGEGRLIVGVLPNLDFKVGKNHRKSEAGIGL